MRDLEAVVETPEHDMVGARDRQGIRTWLLVAVASRTSSHKAGIGLARDRKSCQEREQLQKVNTREQAGPAMLFLSMIPASERPARAMGCCSGVRAAAFARARTVVTSHCSTASSQLSGLVSPRTSRTVTNGLGSLGNIGQMRVLGTQSSTGRVLCTQIAVGS